MTSDLENIACPVCQTVFTERHPKEYYSGTMDMPLSFSELRIAVCPSCRFGFCHTRVSDEDLEAFYSHAYTGKAMKSHGSDLVHVNNPFHFDPRSIAQILLLKSFLPAPLSPTDTLLEIGPGPGSFLHACNRLGLNIEYWCVEPQTAAHDRLRTLGAHTIVGSTFGPHPLSQLKPASFKVIVMSHSLEHFNAQDVPGILQQVHTLLAPGGVFLCEVPNEDLSRYQYYSIPHLSFFSIESLRSVCEQAGMTVEFLSCAGKQEDVRRIIRTSLPDSTQDIFTNDALTRTQQSRSSHRNLEQSLRRKHIKARCLNICEIVFGTSITRFLLTQIAKRRAPDFYTLLKGPDFVYGPDRDVLRLVAIKRASR